MNEQYLSIFRSIDFEKIIDHPNILIAAAFWDDERYKAAKTCYKYMRAIDDLIDCHKSTHRIIADSEKKQFMDSVNAWIAMAHESKIHNQEGDELLDTIRNFHIPVWPLEAFAKSMIYDIDHVGFRTVEDFIDYSQGASVAPASIFVHLSGLSRNGHGYKEPLFDVRKAATPCAMFSYLVHIIRDFQKDQLNNLNYFADDSMIRNGLTSDDLYTMARGGKIKDGFRNMVKEYCNLAEEYKQQTYQVIQSIWPLLEPRYRLSLLIIFNLYLMVFERIEADHGNFTTAELNPTPEEIKIRVHETIRDFRE
jgi:phytoene/squalene synthetase